MRAIVQRVKDAQININGKLYSSIDIGLLIYLGIHKDDNDTDLNYILRKVINLRVFQDKTDKMNLSVKDINGKIMVVSQFTLYGDTRKGNRPNFMNSAKGEVAIKLYEKFVEEISKEIKEVVTGVFGADMQVKYINDGPVTIQLDSNKIY